MSDSNPTSRVGWIVLFQDAVWEGETVLAEEILVHADKEYAQRWTDPVVVNEVEVVEGMAVHGEIPEMVQKTARALLACAEFNPEAPRYRFVRAVAGLV